jgi:hypothetical protein
VTVTQALMYCNVEDEAPTSQNRSVGARAIQHKQLQSMKRGIMGLFNANHI